MSDQQKPKTFAPKPASWIRLYASLMGIVAIVVVAVVGISANQMEKNKKSNTNSASTSSSMQSTSTAAQKASDRLTYLTGITAEQSKKMMMSNSMSAKRDATTSFAPQIRAGGYGGTYSLLSDEEAQKMDTTIAYRKQQIEVGPGAKKEKELLGYTSATYPAVGIYTTQSWFSTNYSKHITEDGDTLMSAAITTPKSTTEYAGGKYALSQEFSTPQYFATFSEADFLNPELSFLKSIAEDTSGMYKKVGSDSINGRAVDVYELNNNIEPYNAAFAMPPKMGLLPNMMMKGVVDRETDPKTTFMATQVSRYYINPETFELVRTERTAGGELVERQTLLASEQLPADRIASIFVLAPYTVEVKSFVAPEYSSYELSHFEAVAKQYSILYPSNIEESKLTNSYASLTFSPDTDEYSKLRNSTAFDPNYTPYISPNPDSEPLFSTSVANTHVTGYATKPDKYQVGDYQGNATFVPFALNIDGVPVTGQKTVFAENNGSGEYLSFLWKNTWMVINQTPDYLDYKYGAPGVTGADIPPFPFIAVLPTEYKTMTLAQAKQVDLTKNMILTNTPRLGVTNFSSISSSLRYLPGDLSSMGVGATSLQAPMPSKTTKCDPTLTTISTYSLFGCLAERHGGFVLDFAPEQNVLGDALRSMLPLPVTSYSDSYMITYAVFDSAIAPLQLNNKITVFLDYDQNKTVLLSSAVVDGITRLTTPSSSAENNSTGTTFYFKEIGGKTVGIVVSPQYPKPSDTDEILKKVKEIFAGVSVDKDKDILSKQIEQSFRPRMY